MSPKSVAVTWGTPTSFTYNGGAQAPSASVTTGVTGETMTVTRTTGTNAGNYTSTASCSSVAGGQKLCKNYTLTGNTKAFSIGRVTLPAPTNIKITTAGIVTWDSVSNATKYQISIDGTNWTDATSGVDYLSKIIAATGTRTVYVRAVGEGNYLTSDNATASKSVYAVTINSNSTTMGTVDVSSYNVIEGVTYSSTIASDKLKSALVFTGITSGTTTKTLKTVTAKAEPGYHFGSWSSASGSITSTATITANFAANTYKVKFASNGGTGTMADQTFTYGKAAALTANTFTKTGYTFKGWTSSDGNIYNDKQNVSNLISIDGGTVTLKALWKANVYEILLSNADIIFVSKDEKIQRNEKIYLKYNDGVYLNYTDGKLSNKMSTNANNIYQPKINLRVNVYESYDVTSDTNGPSGTLTVNYPFMGYYSNDDKKLIDENGNITTEFTNTLFSDNTVINMKLGDQIVSIPTATKTGYTFEGWFNNPGKGSAESPSVQIADGYKFIDDNENITKSIYGHWLKNVEVQLDEENWTYNPVSASPKEESTSDSSTVYYQYCFLNTNNDCTESDWKDITDENYITTFGGDEDEEGNYVDSVIDSFVRYRVFSKHERFVSYGTDENGKFKVNTVTVYTFSTPSSSKHVKIDRTIPSTTLTAYKSGTTTTVENATWTNSFLEYKFGDLVSGPSGAVIKYCIQDESDISTASDGSSSESDYCEPTTMISPNTAIPVDLTNKKEGTYYIAYSVTSTTGIKSAVGIYDARVDVTAPKIVVIPSKKDGETVTKYDTVTASSKAFEDWAIDEYIFDLSTSTDNLSGIDSVLVETNKGGLLTTDSNYREHPTKKTYDGFDTIKELDPIEIQADGYRHGVITVTDNAGNSSKFTFTVKIDGVTPVVSITAKNKSGTAIKSGELSSNGLIFEIKIVKAGVSGAVVYSCGTATSSYDPDNPCDPSARVGAGNTGDVLKITGYANTTSLDRIIIVKGVGGTGIESDVKSFNARIGTTDVDIVVARTDNSERISTRKWVNSTVKFKLVSKSKNIKYCIAKSKCTPSTAITSGTVKSLTDTKKYSGKLFIGYNADSGPTKYFEAYVDLTPPTIKITPYKLKDDNTAGTKVGDTVTNGTLSITDWVKYGYYFSLSGSTDGSGIATTIWKYNDPGSYAVVHETDTTKRYKGLKNFLLGSSGYRYAEVTLIDNAGNSRTIKVGVRIDKVAPKLVLRLYKSVDGKKSGGVIKTVTENNYSTNKWVNYRYYFDTTGSTGGSGLTVTLQANSGGTLDSNHDLTSPVYTITGSGREVGTSGNRYVRVIAKDKAGNTTTKNVRIFIDLGKPTLTWGSHSANGSEMRFNYTCSDTMSRWKNSSGKIVSSVNKTAILKGSGSVSGTCTDRAGNTRTLKSETWYYNSSSTCGVAYYKDNCWTETRQDYLGMDSDYSCVTSGHVCKAPSLGTKCSCYSQPYEVTVCGDSTPVYNTCWHQ